LVIVRTLPLPIHTGSLVSVSISENCLWFPHLQIGNDDIFSDSVPGLLYTVTKKIFVKTLCKLLVKAGDAIVVGVLDWLGSQHEEILKLEGRAE
jgi:hypothetical protein